MPYPNSSALPDVPGDILALAQEVDDVLTTELTGIQGDITALEAEFPRTAFTPTWTNFTLGNGSQSWFYQNVRGVVTVQGAVLLGTTSVVGGNPFFAVPVAGTFINDQVLGRALFSDAGTRYHGSVHYDSGVSAPLMRSFTITSSTVRDVAVSATSPFTWADTDRFSMQFTYRAA
jgi:hypothetical protein